MSLGAATRTIVSRLAERRADGVIFRLRIYYARRAGHCAGRFDRHEWVLAGAHFTNECAPTRTDRPPCHPSRPLGATARGTVSVGFVWPRPPPERRAA